MKKTILILLVLMLSTSLFSQKERYEKDVLRMYDDCKIYSVTEDYSIALAFIPGSAGGSSRRRICGQQGIPVSGQNQWCGCILRGLHL